MIEPLRYKKELSTSYAINQPIYCSRCFSRNNSSSGPSIAVKYCSQCPRKSQFSCSSCDEYIHSYSHSSGHKRRLLVIGPGIRKKVLRRGDAVTFPQPLDHIKVNLKVRVVHENKTIFIEPMRPFHFQSGLSGNTMHIQILGCKGLPTGDIHGSSDPFIILNYNSIQIGTTRVRYRTLNPKWDNETFIVPLDDNLPLIKGVPQSQKDILKLEVFDYDYMTQKDFLGFIEIPKKKLIRLNRDYGDQPIRLNLRLREYHGLMMVRFAIKDDYFYLKIRKAESLDTVDPEQLSHPFCQVYFGDTYIGKTLAVYRSIHPEWTRFNVFHVSIKKLLVEEQRRRTEAQSTSFGALSKSVRDIILFRIEVYSQNTFSANAYLGTVRISAEFIRRHLPQLPEEYVPGLTPAQKMRQFMIRAADRLSGRKYETLAVDSGAARPKLDHGASRGGSASTSGSRDSHRNTASNRAGLPVDQLPEDQTEDDNDNNNEEGGKRFHKKDSLPLAPPGKKLLSAGSSSGYMGSQRMLTADMRLDMAAVPSASLHVQDEGQDDGEDEREDERERYVYADMVAGVGLDEKGGGDRDDLEDEGSFWSQSSFREADGGDLSGNSPTGPSMMHDASAPPWNRIGSNSNSKNNNDRDRDLEEGEERLSVPEDPTVAATLTPVPEIVTATTENQDRYQQNSDEPEDVLLDYSSGHSSHSNGSGSGISRGVDGGKKREIANGHRRQSGDDLDKEGSLLDVSEEEDEEEEEEEEEEASNVTHSPLHSQSSGSPVSKYNNNHSQTRNHISGEEEEGGAVIRTDDGRLVAAAPIFGHYSDPSDSRSRSNNSIGNNSNGDGNDYARDYVSPREREGERERGRGREREGSGSGKRPGSSRSYPHRARKAVMTVLPSRRYCNRQVRKTALSVRNAARALWYRLVLLRHSLQTRLRPQSPPPLPASPVVEQYLSEQSLDDGDSSSGRVDDNDDEGNDVRNNHNIYVNNDSNRNGKGRRNSKIRKLVNRSKRQLRNMSRQLTYRVKLTRYYLLKTVYAGRSAANREAVRPPSRPVLIRDEQHDGDNGSGYPNPDDNKEGVGGGVPGAEGGRGAVNTCWRVSKSTIRSLRESRVVLWLGRSAKGGAERYEGWRRGRRERAVKREADKAARRGSPTLGAGDGDDLDGGTNSIWTAMLSLPVQIDKRNAVEADVSNRGQVIVRLLRAQRGNVIRGLDEGVRHMSLGETAIIKVRYDCAYGSFLSHPYIPPRSWLLITVQLVGINGRTYNRIYSSLIPFFLRLMDVLLGRGTEKPAAKDTVIEEETKDESPIDEGTDCGSVSEDALGKKASRGVIAGGKYMWSWKPDNRPIPMPKRFTAEDWTLLEEEEEEEDRFPFYPAAAYSTGQGGTLNRSNLAGMGQRPFEAGSWRSKTPDSRVPSTVESPKHPGKGASPVPRRQQPGGTASPAVTRRGGANRNHQSSSESSQLSDQDDRKPGRDQTSTLLASSRGRRKSNDSNITSSSGGDAQRSAAPRGRGDDRSSSSFVQPLPLLPPPADAHRDSLSIGSGGGNSNGGSRKSSLSFLAGIKTMRSRMSVTKDKS